MILMAVPAFMTPFGRGAQDPAGGRVSENGREEGS
jgi:hypothetical protein